MQPDGGGAPSCWLSCVCMAQVKQSHGFVSYTSVPASVFGNTISGVLVTPRP